MKGRSRFFLLRSGSSPGRSYVLVAQQVELRPSKPAARVRLPPGTPPFSPFLHITPQARGLCLRRASMTGKPRRPFERGQTLSGTRWGIFYAYFSEVTTLTIYQGDCLEIMKTIPDSSVDMVLTDPPYMINTKSDGFGKLSPWADLCNASLWYKTWIEESRRVLKPTGCLWSFLNWRSFVTFQKVSCDLRWPIESILVWDKCWIGPGGIKGLRQSYELVSLWAMPDFKITDRSLPDIQRFKWSSKKPHGHPAEKPEALTTWLINVSTEKGAVVLDPFMGSGTTGASCVKTGRDFIGMELDPTFFEVAKKRIYGYFQTSPGGDE